MNKIKEKGVTLIGLTVTITLLIILALLMVKFLGGERVISSAKKISFETKVTQYREQVTKYYTRQMSLHGTTDIDTVDPQEISQIIQGIDSEDLEKFVIQDNELKYVTGKVTDEEKTTLKKLGVLEARNMK